MRLQPLGYNVIVKLLKEPEQSVGGIYIPEQAQERSSRAEVIEVGEGYLQADNTFRPCTVKAGDVVIPAKFAGTSIEFEGEDYRIISERDIHAIIKNEGEKN